MTKMFAIFLALFLALPSWLIASESPSEMQKIEALLEAVKTSDLTFIRNGKEYSALEGHKHLEMKLSKAKDSWFAPSKDKWTALMFIEKVASKSSLSGKPYMVRTKDGKILKASDWLHNRLQEIESRKTK